MRSNFQVSSSLVLLHIFGSNYCAALGGLPSARISPDEHSPSLRRLPACIWNATFATTCAVLLRAC
jgi:hypothetical protein